jgi:choline kinase
VKVGHEKIGGLPWTEIDFVEDVTKAERDVLPRL